MEIEGEDGSKTLIKRGLASELGRDLGFKTHDRTISRRQVSFQFHSSPQIDDAKVSFEVTGKNPIWVYNSATDQIKVYRRYEKGELDIGDRFCLSAKNPIWFTLKKIDLGERDSTGVNTMTRLDNDLAESLNSSSGLTDIEDLQLEHVDISNIDPVKEFGFLVIGKEFEGYNSKMIHKIKSLDWFLTEPSMKSEDDDNDNNDANGKGKNIAGRKRKKPKGNKKKDDEWVGESDEDKEMITKSSKIQKSKYSTRSKGSGKIFDAKLSKKPRIAKSTGNSKKEVEDDDDDDETLGGFIVDDEGAEQEVESDVDDNEEEEFEDDEDDE